MRILRVLADLRDIFEVLDRFDIALAQDQNRNSPQALTEYRQPFPNAFPQFNAGVIGFRRTPQVAALLDRWTEAIRDHAIDKDQPSLRELLVEQRSPDRRASARIQSLGSDPDRPSGPHGATRRRGSSIQICS